MKVLLFHIRALGVYLRIQSAPTMGLKTASRTAVITAATITKATMRVGLLLTPEANLVNHKLS